VIALGIDCGTQSLKTIALDGDSGNILASASKAYGLVEGLPAGHLEQDPAIWWNALEETVRQVLADLGPRKAEVAGIGVSGQQHGFVPLDANYQVIRPAKLWCDTSTTAQCDEIRAKLGDARKPSPLVETTSCPVSPRRRFFGSSKTSPPISPSSPMSPCRMIS
jgi:xylulokinase